MFRQRKIHKKQNPETPWRYPMSPSQLGQMPRSAGEKVAWKCPPAINTFSNLLISSFFFLVFFWPSLFSKSTYYEWGYIFACVKLAHICALRMWMILDNPCFSATVRYLELAVTLFLFIMITTHLWEEAFSVNVSVSVAVSLSAAPCWIQSQASACRSLARPQPSFAGRQILLGIGHQQAARI